jgi:hypothetical protein
MTSITRQVTEKEKRIARINMGKDPKPKSFGKLV